MIGMIIIDDEPFIHSVLSDLIDYERIGIKLSNMVSSAEEALNVITPDIKIAIVDIKMRGMSGVEFIEKASKEFPWLKFVVLSGFDDFEYVRKTFKMGAIDYFLKSELNPDRFREVLEKIVRIISSEDIISHTGKIKMYVDAIINKNESNVKIDESVLEEYEKIEKRVMVIKILDYNALKSNALDTIEQCHNYVANVMKNWTKDRNIVCTKKISDEFVLIIPTGISYINGHIVYENIVSELNQKICLKTRCGMSHKFNKLANLAEYYNQASAVAEYCYIAGNNKLLLYSSYANFHGDIDLKKRIDNVRYYIDSMQFAEFKKRLDEIYKTDEIDIKNIDKVKELLYQSYYEIKAYVKKYTVIDNYESVMLEGKTIVNNGSVQDFKKWISNLLDKISSTRNNYSLIVNRTITYMHNNYANPALKLNNFAQNQLSITYNHLSRVFHAETGMKFNQFLTQIRMKKAMELLQNSDYKLYEISEMVGYVNYENFSRTFKSYYGKSPKIFMCRTEE